MRWVDQMKEWRGLKWRNLMGWKRIMFNSRLVIHWKKKWSHFDLKSWVTGKTKIRHGIPSNWKIFESNWLDIESFIINLTQIFSNWLLGIPGRILVPPVTQLFGSKWLHFFFQCRSALNVGDSIWAATCRWVIQIYLMFAWLIGNIVP